MRMLFRWSVSWVSARGKPPFNPPLVDNLGREPTLAEIKRLDAILGTMVGRILQCEPRVVTVQAAALSAIDAQGGKKVANRARAKRRKKGQHGD